MIVNQEDPVQQRLVDDRITTLLAEANLRIAREVGRVASGYLDLILNGGELGFLGTSFDILGLTNAGETLRAVRRQVPPGPSARSSRR